MKKIRGLALVLVLILVTGAFSGCGMKPDDAKTYVKAVLDASYKGEFEEYMAQTKSTEKDAKKMYEGNVDETMKAAGFTELGISEELNKKYRQLFLDMAKQAKYTVGEAKKSGDEGFEVKVKVEPFDSFENLTEEYNKLLEPILADMDLSMTEDEINELAFEKMYELMSKKIADPSYGKATTVTIHVVVDSENVWSIPEEDMTVIDEAMFPV